LESWLQEQREILVLFRYSCAAGAKDFEFMSSFSTLAERIRGLPPETCIIAFRDPQLPLRGVVDDAFMARCLDAIAADAEFLILETAGATSELSFGPRWRGGDSHDELRSDLEDARGIAVAVGHYPPWLEDGDRVVSAVVPHKDGSVKTGVY
jgi:hypothetical protein